MSGKGPPEGAQTQDNFGSLSHRPERGEIAQPCPSPSHGRRPRRPGRITSVAENVLSAGLNQTTCTPKSTI